MDEACRAALKACEAALRPGDMAGDVFDAHARVMDEHGMKAHRLNACGYSLGAKFTPSWMDYPDVLYRQPGTLAANQVFFLHMILMDSDSGSAFCLGRTYILGRDAPEPLSKHPVGMILR